MAAIAWDRLPAPEARSWRLREPLWRHAQQLGMPEAKHPAYVGVRMRLLETLLEKALQTPADHRPVAGSTPEQVDLWIVDGRLIYAAGWLPILTLNQAHLLGPLVQQRYSQIVEQERDPLALVNGAMADEALLGRLPDHFKGRLRVRIDSSTALSVPRLTLWIGEGADVELELLSSGSEDSLSVELIDIVQERSSQLRAVWSRRDGASALHFLRSRLDAKASLRFIDLARGGQISRLDARIELAGEGAAAELYGLGLLQQQRHCQANILIEHRAPACYSRQLFKNVLRDSARSTFQGKIYVGSEAQKTEAYQLNRNLLLSEEARAQSRPNLEILADDVKASHGSTSGPLDPESLFYLLARGMSRETASRLLVRGFALESLQSLPTLSSHLAQQWAEWISTF